jgi:hypothetical protein
VKLFPAPESAFDNGPAPPPPPSASVPPADPPLDPAPEPFDPPLEEPLDKAPEEPPDPPPEEPLDPAPEEPPDPPPEEPLDAPLEEPFVAVQDEPYSKAPRSGSAPLKGRPTSCPLSMRSLPCCNLKKPRQGKLPSAWRGPSMPVIETLWKSASEIVTGSVQELEALSLLGLDSSVPP